MKKAVKIVFGFISFFFTALSVSEAMKKRDQLQKEINKA